MRLSWTATHISADYVKQVHYLTASRYKTQLKAPHVERPEIKCERKGNIWKDDKKIPPLFAYSISTWGVVPSVTQRPSRRSTCPSHRASAFLHRPRRDRLRPPSHPPSPSFSQQPPCARSPQLWSSCKASAFSSGPRWQPALTHICGPVRGSTRSPAHSDIKNVIEFLCGVTRKPTFMLIWWKHRMYLYMQLDITSESK